MEKILSNIKLMRSQLCIMHYALCISAVLLLAACSPDEFSGADPNGLPTVSGTDFQMTVDQETNQMVATYTAAPGTYPIWILNGTQYSVLPEVGYNNPEAGTYAVELKIGNRNGISQAGLRKEFTFNETKIDYTADFRRICGKEWRIANREAAHMGCGPAGTAGTEWWAAAPNDKKDFGVYDDRITFTNDNRKGGTYTYSAGDDGMTYVNYGTHFNTEGATADLDMALGNQTGTWSFEVYEWEDADGNVTKQTYIQLSANTLFPYISSDEQYENPKFRIESLTAKKMVLVYETPERSIAWRFILTSEADERLVEESGFDAGSDFNMWKGITPTATFYFAPGWSPDRTSEMQATYSDGGNDYTVTVPDACADRWQAQMHLHTDLSISAASHYDFSCIFVADKDIDGVTVKLTNETDADAIIDVDNISLKAGQEYVFWKSDLEGKDLSPVKLVFDFGHAAEATVINISNIVLKDHANDDGTVVSGNQPGDDTPEATIDWDSAAVSNLWGAVEEGSAFIKYTTWFADNGWSTLPTQPAVSHADGKWELDVPEGTGGSQWQGQFAIETTLTAAKAKKYNFYLVLEADNDIPGATIKLTETNYSDEDKRDDNFFFADRHDITADQPFVYKAEGVTLTKDDAHALSLVFDFGGAPAATHIAISKIYFEEAVVLSYDDANNLWKSVDEGSAFNQFTTWFADNGWSTLPAQPAIAHNGNAWEFDIPEGIGGSQWQGQFAIETSLATAQNDPYNFSCTILADMDLSGVTIKLTETNYSDEDKRDDNFYFADRHDVKADEPFVYKMTGVTLPKGDAHALSLVFDFGGSPAGAHVKISDIIFEK